MELYHHSSILQHGVLKYRTQRKLRLLLSACLVGEFLYTRKEDLINYIPLNMKSFLFRKDRTCYVCFS